jgi:hypothetical protein
MGLFEEVSDHIGRHDLLCFRCHAGAVMDYNHGNKGNMLAKAS